MTQSWGTLGAATSSALEFGYYGLAPQPRRSRQQHGSGGKSAAAHHHPKKKQQQQKEQKTKRTRRGGRGRSRRRGPMSEAQLEQLEQYDQYDDRYPWWYATMAQSGLTPEGIEPTPEDGFPVILPSCQAVYILPTAVNPHRAATYVPYVTDDSDDGASETSSKSAETANVAPETADFDLDILKVARMRSVTFDPAADLDQDDALDVPARPQLKVSFSFLDINDDDDDDDSQSDTSSSDSDSSS